MNRYEKEREIERGRARERTKEGKPMRGKRNKIHLQRWRETNAFMKIGTHQPEAGAHTPHTHWLWLSDRREN